MNAGTEKIFNAIKEVLNGRGNSIEIRRLPDGTLRIGIMRNGGASWCGVHEYDLELALTQVLESALRREKL